MVVTRSVLLIAACLSVSGGLSGQRTVSRPNPVFLPTTKPPSNLNSSTPSVYLTGKVVIADGSELPPNVVIERLCGARRSALGFANRKGNFSVRLAGDSLASLVDASDDSRSSLGVPSSTLRDQGSVNLIGCALQARYPGYRSNIVEIGSRRILDNPDVGTIVLSRIGTSSSGTMVSATLLSAPKGAMKAYEHGMDSLRKGNRDGARKDFEKAVALHPVFANALDELGRLQAPSDPKAARADFNKAISSDSRYIPPYMDLAVMAFGEKNWEETVSITERGLSLDASGSPQLYLYNAAANFNLKHLDDADKKAREAIKLDASHSLPKAMQLLSYILSAKGDYSGAAEQMRLYLAAVPGGPDTEKARADLQKMEARAGTTRDQAKRDQ